MKKILNNGKIQYQSKLECLVVYLQKLDKKQENTKQFFFDLILFTQLWISLAKKYIYDIHLDWDKTQQFAFSTDSYPEDEQLNMEIVKVNFQNKNKIK